MSRANYEADGRNVSTSKIPEKSGLVFRGWHLPKGKQKKIVASRSSGLSASEERGGESARRYMLSWPGNSALNLAPTFRPPVRIGRHCWWRRRGDHPIRSRCPPARFPTGLELLTLSLNFGVAADIVDIARHLCHVNHGKSPSVALGHGRYYY